MATKLSLLITKKGKRMADSLGIKYVIENFSKENYRQCIEKYCLFLKCMPTSFLLGTLGLETFY